jgi:hypothetical protein
MGQLSPETAADIDRIASTVALPPDMEQKLLKKSDISQETTDAAAALARQYAEKSAPPGAIERWTMILTQRIIRALLSAKTVL